MLKLRYDTTTGAVGEAYNESIIVPNPYILITEEQHDNIKNDTENLYFVKNDVLTPKAKMPILRKQGFEKDFFLTSIGYIRFKPNLKNGSQIDFISLLPQYNAVASVSGLPAGAFLYYAEPDYTQEFTEEYLKSLQYLSPAMTYEQYKNFELEVTNAYQTAFFGQ